MSPQRLKPGQQLELSIETLVPGGEGLARHQGLSVFVPGGLPGDLLATEVISAKSSYARALIQRVLTPSVNRRTPPCELTERCGGCQWQHFDYAAQLLAKRQALLENMQRIGGWEPGALEQITAPVQGMKEPFAYRNKGQFPIQRVQGQSELGFYAPRSHELVPVPSCRIHQPQINAVLAWVRQWLQAHPELSPYDEATDSGDLRHLIVRHSLRTGQSLVGMVTRQDTTLALRPWAQALMAAFPELVGVVQNIQTARGNRILGATYTLLAGQETYLEQLGELVFEVALPAFFQVNPLQTEVLYQAVSELLQPQPSMRILDAYSGAGTIALWLARQSREVVGIEVVAAATANAQRNAERNGISQARFITGKVETLLPELLTEQNFEAAVLDPPRKGCEPEVLAALSRAKIPRLVYVSCNPATLARDSATLRQQGLTLRALRPVDMFPHTHHLETVALFERAPEL